MPGDLVPASQSLPRVKTGAFPEGFAQEAYNSINAFKPSHQIDLPHPDREEDVGGLRFPWNRGHDVEARPSEGHKPEHKSEEEERQWLSPMIPLSYYRRPHKGSEDWAILGTEAEGATPAVAGKHALLWVECRTDSFNSFTTTAAENAPVSQGGKDHIKQWLSSLEMNKTTGHFGGKTMREGLQELSFRDPPQGDTDNDTQQLVSCVFFCFPYLLLGNRTPEMPGGMCHSSRPLVQSLYRSESPFSRELQQAVQMLEGHKTQGVIHVAQVWGLMVNNDYLATFSRSQLHSRPGSSIVTCPLNKFPPAFRLRLNWNLTFCIYWEECPTWVDFLLRVHRIYSQVFGMYVEAELCSYHSFSPLAIIDSRCWPNLVSKAHKGIFDIFVRLPVEICTRQDGRREKARDNVHTTALNSFAIDWRWSQQHETSDIIIEEELTDFVESQIDEYSKLRRDLLARQRREKELRSASKKIDRTRITGKEIARRDRENVDSVDIRGVSGKRYAPGSYYRSSKKVEPWHPPTTLRKGNETKDAGKNDSTAQKNHSKGSEPSTSTGEPVGSTAKTLDWLPYLLWRLEPSDSREEQPIQPWDARTLLNVIHGELSDEDNDWNAVYTSQYKMTYKDVNDILKNLGISTPKYVRGFARSAVELVEHFIGIGLGSEVEMKLWGSLHGILKICQDSKLPEEFSSTVEQAERQILAIFQLSSSIKEGIHGGMDRVFLLCSLVQAFQCLIRAFCLLRDFLLLIPRTTHVEAEGVASSTSNTGSGSPANVQAPRMASVSDIAESEDESKPPPNHDNFAIVPYRWKDGRPARRVTTQSRIMEAFEDADTALLQAKDEILELFDSRSEKELGDYATVSSSGLVASALRFLVEGDTNSLPPEDIYREYCTQLRLAVRDTPKRSLLDDLDRVEEELDSIILMTRRQIYAISELQTIHFRTWPRCEDWQESLLSLRRKVIDKRDVYSDLNYLVEKMRRQVTRQIELEQDNNSKAILVFTTVTVIFLPMSFVTSFFGMNTNDIRDMDHGQWMFWAVSIPVTLAIVGFVTIIAYQGERVKEFFAPLQISKKHRR